MRTFFATSIDSESSWIVQGGSEDQAREAFEASFGGAGRPPEVELEEIFFVNGVAELPSMQENPR